MSMSLRRKPVDVNFVWPKLKSELSKVLNFSGPNGNVTGMDLYQMVYDLCNAHPKSFSMTLQENLTFLLIDHMTKVRNTLSSSANLVKSYASEWDQYRIAVQCIDSVCEYLNRMIENKINVPPGEDIKKDFEEIVRLHVSSLGFHIWYKAVLVYFRDSIGNQIVKQVFQRIESDRNGLYDNEKDTCAVIQSFIQCLEHTSYPMQFYIDECETPGLDLTRKYYQKECSNLIATMDIWTYMIKIQARLEEERLRIRKYFHSSSYEKFIKTCIHEMIFQYQQNIQAAFENFLANDEKEAMKLCYNLLILISDGTKPLLAHLERHIIKLGRDGVLRVGVAVIKEPKTYVDCLSTLYRKYCDTVAECFRQDASFEASLDKAFRTIVNDTTTNPHAIAPEVLSRYSDMLIRKGVKIENSIINENEVEAFLTDIMSIFKFVDEKDIFQQFYSRQLAKRLIFGLSVSNDVEVSMISRLKAFCGYEYTSKLQRMITDLTVSSELSSVYHTQKTRDSGNISLPDEKYSDFTVLVLTTGSWPISANSQLEYQLPKEIEDCLNSFHTFYQQRHSGRKLTWLNHLAKCDVKAFGFDKRYEFQVSMCQFSIMNLFNESDCISVKDILQVSRLSMQEFKRHFKALLDMGLFKTDAAKFEDLIENDTILVNNGFSFKRLKIKVQQITQTEAPKEREATHKAVDDDRKLYLQAAIVRIMKSRKEISHLELVQEIIVLSKSRFVPNLPIIKKCIEQLIEKQYLERSADNKDRYLYVA